jgi:hypothetical protein
MGFVQHEQQASGIQLERLAGPMDRGDGWWHPKGLKITASRSIARGTLEVRMVVRRHLARPG